MNESSLCIICDEKFNKTNHFLITCLYCATEACRTCCQTYILGQNLPKCMNNACGKEWTRKFLVQVFPKTFVNKDLKKHKEKVLLEKELSLLPATQGVVEAQIEKEKLLAEVAQVNALIRDLYRRRDNLNIQVVNTDGNNAHNKPRNFVRACPVEDCRGFLSTQWKCGLCETYTCSQCHVVKSKTEEHVCNTDDLATAALLSKDTKPCPSCHTGIFKIEGCDQMWCTQCHTAFSWKTGQLESKIHNPHFYEWQRRTGGIPRVQGDIQCGQEINHLIENSFFNILAGDKSIIAPRGRFNNIDVNKHSIYFKEILSILRKTIQNMVHLREVQMVNYRVDQVENNIKLRIMYMRKQINKETFQIRIQRDNKKHEKNREMHDILHMFIQAVTDVIYRALSLLEKGKTLFYAENLVSKLSERTVVEENVLGVMKEIEAIRLYTNECILEICNVYESKPKQIVLHDRTDHHGRRNIDVLIPFYEEQKENIVIEGKGPVGLV